MHRLIDLSRRRWLTAFGASLVTPWAMPLSAHAQVSPLPQRQSWPAARITPILNLPMLAEAGAPTRPWSLADAAGKAVLINFWATWCPPCRNEMASLELLQQRHHDKGLLVVAVNFKEGAPAIRRFVDATDFSLPVLRDIDGNAARAWGVRSFPTTIAIGRDGRAQFSVVGEADWTAAPARQWVDALV